MTVQTAAAPGRRVAIGSAGVPRRLARDAPRPCVDKAAKSGADGARTRWPPQDRLASTRGGLREFRALSFGTAIALRSCRDHRGCEARASENRTERSAP